jgi:hypothetical protein
VEVLGSFYRPVAGRRRGRAWGKEMATDGLPLVG